MQLDYHLSADEWANACLYYSESNSMMRFAIKSLTMLAFLLVPLFVLYAIDHGFKSLDFIFGVSVIFWLFFRRHVNLKFMKHRLKKRGFENNPVSIQLTDNGVVWRIAGAPDAKKSWDSIKSLIELKSGFIIPDKEFRFIYIPKRCFNENHMAKFQDFINRYKIKVRHFPKWSC